ncbi:MAG: glycoside hydrolase family 9 protein, partial [Fibrobacterota bacterium]
MASRSPITILGISQIGYRPDEIKKAIVRVPCESETPFHQAAYEITAIGQSAPAIQARMQIQAASNNGSGFYYIADFSKLNTPGSYRFSARLSGPRGVTNIQSGVFCVEANLWTDKVIPSQYSFFDNYRCGVNCHTSAPVRGGYHDAAGDYVVRMWSIPHVAFGMSEYILCSSNPSPKALDELKWTVDWLLALQAPDGNVQCLVIRREDEFSQYLRRPIDDSFRHFIEEEKYLPSRISYVAGLAHAARVFRTRDTNLADRCEAAAVRAWGRVSSHDWKSCGTGDMGNFLWSSVELFDLTEDTNYLQQACAVVPLILRRQYLNPRRVQYGLYGDFFDDPLKTSFGDKQYKKFTWLGLYAGLVDLFRILPAQDPLRARIGQALDIYFDNYVLRGAALTPYGQMITGLEPTTNNQFRVFFFTHRDAWTGFHGLNVDHFAIGWVAAKYARLTGRKDLLDFANAQAQWVAGCNPLGYCMIDHLGWKNPPMLDDNIGTGRFAGGIPNGIIGDFNDRPDWAFGSTCWGSREYWLPHNAYLLALVPYLDP